MLSGPAVDRLKNSRVSEVVVTNTLPIAPEQQFDKLTVLSIAPLLARAIKEVFEDGSVTSLFDGAQLARRPPDADRGRSRASAAEPLPPSARGPVRARAVSGCGPVAGRRVLSSQPGEGAPAP